MSNKKRVSKALKQKDVISRYRKLYGNKFDYSLFIYKNAKTKGKIKCNICGIIFEQRPDSHLAGNGCPNCAKLYIARLRTIAQDELIKRFIEIHGNKYDYSKTITNGVNNKSCFICKEHGEFFQTPNNHLKGHGCPKCQRVNHAKFLLLDQKTVINRFITVHGNRFGYDNFIYKGYHIKGEITCRDHGPFLQTPNNHLKGQGCPKCKYSKGEAALENIFIKNNIKYEAQFKLPYYNYEYDFHLPDYGVLVEFHGKQHYEPVMEFGGIERFNQQIENDKIKRSLAREYRTLLIEVHYKYLDHKNIEKFEQFFLKKLERKLKSSNWMTS
jgi:hypothetical protein